MNAQKISPPFRAILSPGLCEYLLVVPAQDEKVLAERQDFFDRYRSSPMRAAPHIPVFSFRAWDHMEGSVVRGMQKALSGLESFSITLNNYSGFPPASVFIRIADQAHIERVSGRLTAIAPLIKDWRRFQAKSNLRISGDLAPEEFERALNEYSGRDFHATLGVNRLVLLRKDHEEDDYREVAFFQLTGNHDHKN